MQNFKDAYSQDINLGDAVVILCGSSAFDSRSFSFVTRFSDNNKIKVTRVSKYSGNFFSSYIDTANLMVVTKQLDQTLPDGYTSAKEAVKTEIQTDVVEKKKTRSYSITRSLKNPDNFYVIKTEGCNAAQHNAQLLEVESKFNELEGNPYCYNVYNVFKNRRGEYVLTKYSNNFNLSKTDIVKLIGHCNFETGITLVSAEQLTDTLLEKVKINHR